MKSTLLLWIRPLFRYSFAMIFKEISLEEIDAEDETFRISEELDSAPVLDSLREIGQLNPVVLLDQKKLKRIVCGFRRVQALKRLGKDQVLARVLSEESRTPTGFLELALWDNLSHRQLDPLEKARVLHKLRDACGVSDPVLVRVYLPLLGLMPNESILHAYLSLNGVRPGLRRCLAEGRLTRSTVERLAKTPGQVQDSVASLMGRIRLSASSQKKALDLLDDISALMGARLDAPLACPEALAASDDPRLSPFQRGEKVYEILYRLRNPRLSEAFERFLTRKKSLRLPGSIRISPHPFFETQDLRVEFDASDAGSFRELATELQRASESTELEKLFQTD
jgi:hypothetical protein